MLKLGTSGFSYPDWKGTVYPKKLQPKDALTYYEQELGFDCVEINSAYYNIVSSNIFDSMAKKTGRNFEFVVKAYKGITHDLFDYRLKEKPSVDKVKTDIDKFVHSLSPLKESGKLGCVLLQFPVFFQPSSRNNDYILECKECFGDIPLVIEFRNSRWATKETFNILRRNNVGHCVVDEPKLERLMPAIYEVTSDIGYLRFHGRNSNWFNTSVKERYNYLYSDKELKEFIPNIHKIDKKAQKTYLFFNNCTNGQSVKNAVTLKKYLNMETKKHNLF
ncbi:MAG: DUF72 domain-containing protein [Elusimicrobia bacterium]|nr:DUF72 domain-containing protein [Elusimicrobiota bacterium]